MYEFPQILCEATAKIEERSALAETSENERVGGRAREAEIDEAELAYAGEGVDFPGSIALWILVRLKMGGAREERGRSLRFRGYVGLLLKEGCGCSFRGGRAGPQRCSRGLVGTILRFCLECRACEVGSRSR